MKKYIILSWILIFGITNILSQEQPEFIDFPYTIENIIAPGPTAASLAKYGEQEVNLFTGTPSISIPVWEIKTRDLSLPITLSYHAGGLKVEEVPSWVGAGWSLNAGGVITRTVFGKPDEKFATGTPGFYWNNNPESYNFVVSDDDDYRNLDKLASDNYKDFKPDKFFYNFNKYSGKFIFKNNAHTLTTTQNTNTIPFEKLKIETIITDETTGKEIDKVIITTVDGTTYIFDKKEISDTETHIGYQTYLTFNAINSWYLSEIISVNGDKILFVYEYETMTDSKPVCSYGSYYFNFTDWGGGFSQYPGNRINNMKVETTTSSPRLDKIISSNTIIHFIEYDYRRDDIYKLTQDGPDDERQNFALSEIKIYSRTDNETTPNDDNLIKSFIFSHDYSIGSDSYISRLTLKGLSEVDNKGTPNNPYIFEYKNPGDFPSLRSKEQDHWGYYKGNCNPEPDNLIPEIEYTYSTTGGQTITRTFPDTGNHSDRETDPTSVDCGILTSLTYPTKGYTEYEYECNQVENYVNSTEDEFDYTESITIDIQGYQGSGSMSCKTFNYLYIPTNSMSSYSFTVPQDTKSNQYAFNAEYNLECTNCIGGDLIWGIAGLINITTGEHQLLAYDECEHISGSYSTILNLSGGNSYKLYVAAFLSPENAVSCTMSYNEQLTGGTQQSGTNVGGLRIKKITDYPGDFESSKEITRVFDYENGQLFTLPEYYFLFRQANFEGGWFTGFHNFINIHASNQAIPGTSGGSPAGYEKVFVSKIDGDGNPLGVEKNYFMLNDMPVDDYLTIHSFPYPPVEPVSPLLGKLYEQEIRDADNNLIKYTENEYFSEVIDHVEALKVGELIDWGIHLPYTEFRELSMKPVYYNLNTEWIYLKKTTITEYDNNDISKYVQTTNDYIYEEAPTHYQLKMTVENQGNENEVTTKLYYPQDKKYANVSGMIDNYMIGEIIEKEKLNKDNEIVFANYIDYKQENDLILPDIVRVYNKDLSGSGADKYEDKMLYEDFDEYGNIQRIRKANDASVVILWGYNYTLPVAQITNADDFDLNDPAYTTNIQALSGQDLINALESLRNAYPKSQVTIYTHKPLVGQQYIVDPNGKRSEYIYDSFGRLITVKDQDGKILKHIEYHYSENE